MQNFSTISSKLCQGQKSTGTWGVNFTIIATRNILTFCILTVYFLLVMFHESKHPPSLYQVITGLGWPVALQVNMASPPSTTLWSLGRSANVGGTKRHKNSIVIYGTCKCLPN